MPTRELIQSDKFKGWVVRLTLQDGTVLRASNFRRRRLAEDPNTIDVDMQFYIAWNVVTTIPSGEIIIKNVQNESGLKFRQGDLMTLQAGWAPDQQDETVALLLAIEDIETEVRGKAKTSFYIQVSDAAFPLLTRGVAASWKPGASAHEEVFPDLVKAAQMKVGKVAPKRSYVYEKGFCVWGPLWHGLRQVAEDTQSFVSYWGGEVNLLDPQEGLPTDFTLSADNGVLVGSQVLAEWPVDETLRVLPLEFEHPAYRVTSMLTSRIFPNAIYNLRAPEISEDTLRVRAIRGRYYNDGSNQRVVNDVLLVDQGGSSPLGEKATPQLMGEQVGGKGKKLSQVKEEDIWP